MVVHCRGTCRCRNLTTPSSQHARNNPIHKLDFLVKPKTGAGERIEIRKEMNLRFSEQAKLPRVLNEVNLKTERGMDKGSVSKK